VRPAQEPREEPDRRRRRPTDLDRIHGKGAERDPGGAAHGPGGRDQRAGPGRARRRPSRSRILLPGGRSATGGAAASGSADRATRPPGQRTPALGRQNYAGPALRRDQLRKRGKELRTVARVLPGRAVPPKVEAARARRHPDLARRAVAVHDDLRAVAELELEHGAFLELDVRVDAAFVQRALDGAQRLRRQGFELPLIHGLTCGFYALPRLIWCVSCCPWSPWRWPRP